MKKLEELFQPDIGNSCHVIINHETGSVRPFTLEDHYQIIEPVKLAEHVPVEVLNQFEVAKDLYVYAWFVYEFFPVAHIKLLTTLEYALKKCIDEKELDEFCKRRKRRTQNLSTLILFVREKKLIKREDFKRFEASPLEDSKILDLVLNHLVDSRNKHSHGSLNITDQIVQHFHDISAIINNCYE